MKMIKAQALLEVAIFGAIIIMLLGVLISYGLRYNYQQKTMQQAFRKTLARSVAQPGVSVSNVVISDEHIPNPSDTFGVGSVTPFTGASGGVSRDYLADPEERYTTAPTVVYNINGEERAYTTAGFRDEYNVPASILGISASSSISNIDDIALGASRYQVVYGTGNVWVTGVGACLGTENPSFNPNTGEMETPTCSESSFNIRILDSCSGEIIDYGNAVKQCRMIVDSAACLKECSRGSSVSCSVCSQPIEVPWYCANYQETNTVTHAYTFPVLEKLFSSSALKAMGLLQDYSQNTTTVNTLNKAEDASGITVTDTIDWKTTTTRKIVTHTPGSTTGDPNVSEVKSEVSQKKTESRQTDW